MRVFDEFRHGGVDAAIRAQPREIRSKTHHAAQRIERDVGELFKADAAEFLAELHEPGVAVQIVGRDARDFPLHRGVVGQAVEMAAVIEHDAVVRIKRAQIDIAGEFPAAQRLQVFEEERDGDNRRAAVEGEAVLHKGSTAAAGAVEPLQYRDVIAPRAEPDRCRETTEAAADYDGPRFGRDVWGLLIG